MSGLLKTQIKQHLNNKASLEREYLASLIAEASRNSEDENTNSSNRNSSSLKRLKESIASSTKDDKQQVSSDIDR